jgi:hypothetical protein
VKCFRFFSLFLPFRNGCPSISSTMHGVKKQERTPEKVQADTERFEKCRAALAIALDRVRQNSTLPLDL